MDIWGAYDCSTRHYYEDDGGGSDYHEQLLDADTNVERLRKRVNAYFAQPEIIDFYRNKRYEIAKGEVRSRTFNAEGGGCMGSHTIVLKKLPHLELK